VRITPPSCQTLTKKKKKVGYERVKTSTTTKTTTDDGINLNGTTHGKGLGGGLKKAGRKGIQAKDPRAM